MAEVVLKNGQPVPQKKKRKKSVAARIIIALLVIFFGIPLLLVGLVYALFYDSVHTPIKHRLNYPNEEVFNDVITHSLDYTESLHQMRLRVTEDALNQLFHNVTHNEDDELIFDVVNNLYVKINKSTYTFVLEVNLYGFFKTRVFLTTKLQVTDDDVIFKVTNLKVGRVGKLNNLSSIITKFFKLPDFNKILEDNGFHMTLDIANLSLKYPKENFFEDLSNSLGESASGYLSLFTEVMFNDNFTTIIPNSEKAIELNVNLENMRPSEIYHITGYEMPQGYLDELLPAAINKVKGYLESDTITLEDAEALTNYYVKGYEHIDGDYKTKVDGYLSSHAIDEATNTYDYDIPNADNLATIANSQLSHYPSGSSYYEVTYTTNQIDRALAQAGAIGTTILFKSKEEDGTYTLNYMAFDRVTNVIDAGNDCFYLTISISMNGYDVGLSLRTAFDHSFDSYGKARFVLEDMYVGDVAISSSAKEFFMDLITQAIEDSASSNVVSLETDGDTLYLKVDMVDILNAHNVTEENGYATSYEMTAQTATEPGILTFKAQK